MNNMFRASRGQCERRYTLPERFELPEKFAAIRRVIHHRAVRRKQNV